MNLKQMKAAIEAMLFAYAEPISSQKLAQILQIEQEQLEELLHQLAREYQAQEHGIMLLQIENQWQFCTKNEYGFYVKSILDKRRNIPLSQAAIEVLAIIAYNQPVSRAFIEQVRGVDSSGAVQTLIHKGLIEEAGRMNLPGKPLAFQTTDAFLRTFGLQSLTQLPAIHSMQQEGDG